MRISHVVSNAALLIAVSCIPVVGQQNGYLKMGVSPGRAGVFVDGKYVGPAANFSIGRKYAVAAGTHEVRLAEPRYEEAVVKVTVVAGKTTKVSESLKLLPPPKPPFGTLRTVSSDKFAAVYVNGRYMGHVDEFSNSMQGLKLNPGDYTVKVVSAGTEQGREEKIKIEANKTTLFHHQK
jgi:hypothetical protein